MKLKVEGTIIEVNGFTERSKVATVELAYWQRSRRHISQMDAGAGCVAQLLQDVVPATGLTVLEYMGGIGRMSVILANRLAPSRHEIYERDAPCVTIISSLKLPQAHVLQGDYFKIAGHCTADIHVLDFNAFTLHTFLEEAAHRQALVDIFATSPLAVMITDSAVNKLHFHWQRYKALAYTKSGYPTSYEVEVAQEDARVGEYIKQFSDVLRCLTGYGVRAARYHRGAAYLWCQRWEGPTTVAKGNLRGLVREEVPVHA